MTHMAVLLISFLFSNSSCSIVFLCDVRMKIGSDDECILVLKLLFMNFLAGELSCAQANDVYDL